MKLVTCILIGAIATYFIFDALAPYLIPSPDFGTILSF